MNRGFGDAVDLGWKLAAALQGWGGPGLLYSYEAERRPVQDHVIRAAHENMKTLSSDLVADDLDVGTPAGDVVRRDAHRRIQETKYAEFHDLDLDLDLGRSPVVARAGSRLPHAWLPDGRSLYDVLGPGLTLLAQPGDQTAALREVCARRPPDRRGPPRRQERWRSAGGPSRPARPAHSLVRPRSTERPGRPGGPCDGLCATHAASPMTRLPVLRARRSRRDRSGTLCDYPFNRLPSTPTIRRAGSIVTTEEAAWPTRCRASGRGSTECRTSAPQRGRRDHPAPAEARSP